MNPDCIYFASLRLHSANIFSGCLPNNVCFFRWLWRRRREATCQILTRKSESPSKLQPSSSCWWIKTFLDLDYPFVWVMNIFYVMKLWIFVKCLPRFWFKCRYLVPGEITLGQFVYVIRKRINLSAEKAIFMFVDNVLPSTGTLFVTTALLISFMFHINHQLYFFCLWSSQEHWCPNFMKIRKMKMGSFTFSTVERTPLEARICSRSLRIMPPTEFPPLANCCTYCQYRIIIMESADILSSGSENSVWSYRNSSSFIVSFMHFLLSYCVCVIFMWI